MIARGAESAETTEMGTETTSMVVHPEGEQPEVEAWSAVADTYAGRVHVEWDATAPVTPFGQLPFFIEYLKQGGLFDGWVADCPLSLSSPNAPRKRDLLGTVLLSVLAGHRRYAHITALRCDPVNPPLLGMRKVLSEDAVRRNLGKIDEAPGLIWLQGHLDYSVAPLLDEPWVLDVDTTIKPLYGEQEGAELGYNPHKPGRPSHCYHTYMLSNLRLVLGVDVQPGGAAKSLPLACQLNFTFARAVAGLRNHDTSGACPRKSNNPPPSAVTFSPRRPAAPPSGCGGPLVPAGR